MNFMSATRPTILVRIISVLVGLITVMLPFTAYAAPFGGKTSLVYPCLNVAIYAVVGGPRGGFFIWTPATKTYANGPPAPGKWLLGLSGVPYFCILLLPFLFVLPGISISMMGSSR